MYHNVLWISLYKKAFRGGGRGGRKEEEDSEGDKVGGVGWRMVGEEQKRGGGGQGEEKYPKLNPF
jgi:hypothetical protein